MASYLFRAALMSVLAAPLPALAAEGDWMPVSRADAAIEQLKRAGRMPHEIDCRNAPEARGWLKPQIRFASKPDTGGKSWVFYAYVGQIDFKPGKPEQWNRWRRTFHKVVEGGGGGSKFHCSLFVEK